MNQSVVSSYGEARKSLAPRIMNITRYVKSLVMRQHLLLYVIKSQVTALDNSVVTAHNVYMSIETRIHIKCNGGDVSEGGTWPQDFTACANSFSYDGIQDQKSIRKSAKVEGWAIGRSLNGFDYCPAHRSQA